MRDTRAGSLALTLIAAATAAATAPTSAAAAAAPTSGADVAAAAAPAPAEAATFEELLRGAAPAPEIGALLAPFVGKCGGEERELDRVRCRTTRTYLRRVIPEQSFWTIANDPAAIAVSDFDGAIKGYHLSLAGCLACTTPVALGRAGDSRFVTLQAPDKKGESLRDAVEVGRHAVSFESLPEAKAWLSQGRPELRAQFVFQPTDTEWTHGGRRGYALTLLGVRVFNRCTGEILTSRPPSTGAVDLPGIDDGCHAERATAGATAGAAPATAAGPQSALPRILDTQQIAAAMAEIRPQVFACFTTFHVPGQARLEYEVAGNGTVQSLHLSGAFGGTPTGACLIQAGQNAHFPPFASERQRFAYPFFLRQ